LRFGVLDIPEPNTIGRGTIPSSIQLAVHDDSLAACWRCVGGDPAAARAEDFVLERVASSGETPTRLSPYLRRHSHNEGAWDPPRTRAESPASCMY
jgi:hypothetical protein